MDQVYDFSHDTKIFRNLGGSDRKFMVDHDGIYYMLKFSEAHAKRTDISTSYVNSVVSEYVSSHIAASIGIPTHQTVLGVYKDQLVVGCRDFRSSQQENIEFGEFVRGIYDSKDVKRVIRLDQIYETLADADTFSPELREKSIERYWDTFVADALVGNFDRHIGNWGYLSDLRTNQLTLAPTYDYGSTLLPQLADEGMSQIIHNKHEMLTRCMVFPSPALFILEEKAGKVGYYDLMSSGYDKYCTEAVKRIVPKVDLEKINKIIDNTPMISDIRRAFYKEFISLRKEIILDRAYERCITQEYDRDAYDRICTGHQFQESMVDREFAGFRFPKDRQEHSEPISAQMERIWESYFNKPKDERNGIEWRGQIYRPVVFDDMYIAQCQNDGTVPNKAIATHFAKCIDGLDYTPKYSAGHNLKIEPKE